MFKESKSNTIIKEELEKINKYFQKNELAYLALTSKIELPIRDKLAFRLHTKLSSQGLKVSREWKGGKRKRVDIAIIKNKESFALFEFKAMYIFDGTEIKKDVNHYPKLMIEDLLKIQKLAMKDTKLYSILFATHPLKKIEESLNGIVKYMKDINKAFERYKTAEKILEICDRNVKKFLKDKNFKTTHGVIDAGRCFNVKVKIPFWIISSLNKNDELF